MKKHLRNLQSGVAFWLCLVAVRKRIYGLRQTQNAASCYMNDNALFLFWFPNQRIEEIEFLCLDICYLLSLYKEKELCLLLEYIGG